MHHHTELPFVNKFWWDSPHHFLKNEWQNAVPHLCMLRVGLPYLHYCCAVMLRSSIILPPVGHSSNHKYHCCQLTGQSSSISNFYHTFKVFIWLTFIIWQEKCQFHSWVHATFWTEWQQVLPESILLFFPRLWSFSNFCYDLTYHKPDLQQSDSSTSQALWHTIQTVQHFTIRTAHNPFSSVQLFH
jgi:hypothetical protein